MKSVIKHPNNIISCKLYEIYQHLIIVINRHQLGSSLDLVLIPATCAEKSRVFAICSLISEGNHDSVAMKAANEKNKSTRT